MQGAYKKTIVYQGTMARLYTDVRDPRTDKQQDNRYLFGDFRKVVKTAGLLAKTFLRSKFGKAYMANAYAYVKQNDTGIWEEALENWEALSEEDQQYLRENAPCLATWNDPGKVFYMVIYTLVDFSNQTNRYDWGLAEAWSNGLEETLHWWGEDIIQAIYRGVYDHLDSHITFAHGKITVLSGPNEYGGSWAYINWYAPTYYEFTFYGMYCQIGYLGDYQQPNAKVEIDDMDEMYMKQTRAHITHRCQWCTPKLEKGYHHIRVWGGILQLTSLDYVVIYETKSLRTTPYKGKAHEWVFAKLVPFGVNDEVWFADSSAGENVLCIGGNMDLG